MVTLEQIETGLAVAVSWVGNPWSMWLAIHRKPFGWWIVAVTQAAFVGFAVTSGDWRFGGQALCLAMGIYGVWRWQVKRRHEPAIGDAIPTMRLPQLDPMSEDAVREATAAAYRRWMAQAGLKATEWAEFEEDHPREAQQWVEAMRAGLAVGHAAPPIADPVKVGVR
jgi:hypothetical protein